MSNKSRSKNARNTRIQQDTATRKQLEARKRKKVVHKQKMPGQNKMFMLIGLAILCVGMIAPELLAMLGTRVAAILKWLAVIAIVLAIVATRYKMTASECVGWLIDKLLNREEEYEDEEEDEEEEWDDDEDWEDFCDDEDEIVEEPKPAVRKRAPVAPAPVPAPAVEEAVVPQYSKENYELFMQFMEFQKAQKAQATKPEPAPKTSKK